jgi:hypothetical protein
VKRYERYYEPVLVPEVRNQYMINDRNLKDLLLSPGLRKNQNGNSTCSYCFSGMQPNMTRKNVFNFNTNIQIGDVSQVFYSTLYTSKSTQEEDSEKQLRIGRAVIKRMKRLFEESSSRESSNDGCNQATLEPSFCEGLCRVLSGLNAATTRNIVNATMAHLIPSNKGSHFIFSHDFSELLVGQIEATLEGQDVNVRIRTGKLPDGEVKSWPDSLADDYIHHPRHQDFECMSLYEMTRCYKKVFKPLQRESKVGYTFSDTHPGYEFSHLIKLRHKTVPRIFLPTERVCPLKDLQLNTTKPTEESLEKREIYAKMALLMFYPVRSLADLRIEGSYWKKISQQLQSHLEHEKTIFWHKGFDILKNINDRIQDDSRKKTKTSQGSNFFDNQKQKA